MALSMGGITKVQPGAKLSLGILSKTDPTWVAAIKWEPSPGTEKVDCDLWMALLGPDGQAIDFVRYDETNATARVVSQFTKALEYLGDDRDGSSSDRDGKPFDENGLIHLDKAAAAGGVRVLVIANIYEPRGMTFDRVAEAGIAVWAGSDIMNPVNPVGMSLSSLGQGANTVIFGWLALESDGTWSFHNQPSHAPSIQEALAPFGIG